MALPAQSLSPPLDPAPDDPYGDASIVRIAGAGRALRHERDRQAVDLADDAFGEVRAEFERGWQLERLGERARDLGHELVGWIRSDNESVTCCGRGDARLYVHTGDAPALSDREALTLPCPGA